MDHHLLRNKERYRLFIVFIFGIVGYLLGDWGINSYESYIIFSATLMSIVIAEYFFDILFIRNKEVIQLSETLLKSLDVALGDRVIGSSRATFYKLLSNFKNLENTKWATFKVLSELFDRIFASEELIKCEMSMHHYTETLIHYLDNVKEKAFWTCLYVPSFFYEETIPLDAHLKKLNNLKIKNKIRIVILEDAQITDTLDPKNTVNLNRFVFDNKHVKLFWANKNDLKRHYPHVIIGDYASFDDEVVIEFKEKKEPSQAELTDIKLDTREVYFALGTEAKKRMEIFDELGKAIKIDKHKLGCFLNTEQFKAQYSVRKTA